MELTPNSASATDANMTSPPLPSPETETDFTYFDVPDRAENPSNSNDTPRPLFERAQESESYPEPPPSPRPGSSSAGFDPFVPPPSPRPDSGFDSFDTFDKIVQKRSKRSRKSSLDTAQPLFPEDPIASNPFDILAEEQFAEEKNNVNLSPEYLQYLYQKFPTNRKPSSENTMPTRPVRLSPHGYLWETDPPLRSITDKPPPFRRYENEISPRHDAEEERIAREEAAVREAEKKVVDPGLAARRLERLEEAERKLRFKRAEAKRMVRDGAPGWI